MCIYVHSLTIAEGKKVQSILRRSKDRVAMRRAQVVALSGQGMRVQEIARAVCLSEEYVRMLVRRFNQEGTALFSPADWKGRPIEFTEELKAEIVDCALCPPRVLQQPFNRWSLDKLKTYLMGARIVKSMSIETLRTILREHGVRLQRTKTWKESTDPHFERKKNA
jgi:transposase